MEQDNANKLKNGLKAPMKMFESIFKVQSVMTQSL